ncbi:hypothetical protein Tco_0656554 [Tanacetum coccineum]|uniref:Uncharacterized protein n=1 Tax=Tanacetum coccineum TaxID=301880 RepID=A0ABQ4X924_9ASTR
MPYSECTLSHDYIRGAITTDAYLKKVPSITDIFAGKTTPPAKRAKAGKVAKKRTLKKSQQLVRMSLIDEDISIDMKPGFGDLEADTQRAIEESLKDAHGAYRGPLPPVVFRETDTGKYQPLPKVEGKGKEKVGAEQAARVTPPNWVAAE